MYRVRLGKVMWRDDDGLHIIRKGKTCNPPEAVIARSRNQLEFIGDRRDRQSMQEAIGATDTQMKRDAAETRTVAPPAADVDGTPEPPAPAAPPAETETPAAAAPAAEAKPPATPATKKKPAAKKTAAKKTTTKKAATKKTATKKR